MKKNDASAKLKKQEDERSKRTINWTGVIQAVITGVSVAVVTYYATRGAS